MIRCRPSSDHAVEHSTKPSSCKRDTPRNTRNRATSALFSARCIARRRRAPQPYTHAAVAPEAPHVHDQDRGGHFLTISTHICTQINAWPPRAFPVAIPQLGGCASHGVWWGGRGRPGGGPDDKPPPLRRPPRASAVRPRQDPRRWVQVRSVGGPPLAPPARRQPSQQLGQRGQGAGLGAGGWGQKHWWVAECRVAAPTATRSMLLVGRWGRGGLMGEAGPRERGGREVRGGTALLLCLPGWVGGGGGRGGGGGCWWG